MKMEQVWKLRDLAVPGDAVRLGGVGGAGGLMPWRTMRNDLEETKRVSVRPGSLSSILPTNIFDFLTISGSGVEYLVLTGAVSPSGGVISCELSIETDMPAASEPTPEAPSSEIRDVIAVLSDGKIYQVRDSNLNAVAVELFQVSIAEPAPGARQYTPWYVWTVVGAD